MTKENDTIDILDPIMLEYPFVREGMTLEEYFEEKEYYFSISIDDHHKGKNKPLWKQRKEKQASQ